MSLHLTLEHHKFELCRYIYTWVFSTNMQSALLIPGFCIFRFNQPLIKNSIFDLQLRVHRYRRLNTIVCRFSTVRGLVPLTPTLFKGQLFNSRAGLWKLVERRGWTHHSSQMTLGLAFFLRARFGWVLIWRVCRGRCFGMACGCTALRTCSILACLVKTLCW